MDRNYEDLVQAMSKKKTKTKTLTPEQQEEIRTKDFFDCILPGTVKFYTDHYIVGDSYRSVWAIKEYPPTTEEQAIGTAGANIFVSSSRRSICFRSFPCTRITGRSTAMPPPARFPTEFYSKC